MKRIFALLMTGIIFTLLLTVVLCLPSNGYAVVITYDEAVHGDFVHGLPYDQTTNVGTFDVGVNTVSGSIFRLISGPKDSSDEFNFNIPIGLSLTSVTLNFTNVTGLAHMTVFLKKIDDISIPTIFYNEPTVIDFNTDLSPISAFEGVLPTGVGTYQVNSPGNYGFFDNVDVNIYYTWQFEVAPMPELVDIDIKPHSWRNIINRRGWGFIPVAILSDGDFDATSKVDRTSLTFGQTGDEESLWFCLRRGRDVNRDGYRDLICLFWNRKAGFQCGDIEGNLKGQTKDSSPIEGSDSVRIVPCR